MRIRANPRDTGSAHVPQPAPTPQRTTAISGRITSRVRCFSQPLTALLSSRACDLRCATIGSNGWPQRTARPGSGRQSRLVRPASLFSSACLPCHTTCTLATARPPDGSTLVERGGSLNELPDTRPAVGRRRRGAVLLPPGIVEYITAHELVHLREPRHTHDFWRRLERAIPDFGQRREWLGEGGGRVG